MWWYMVYGIWYIVYGIVATVWNNENNCAYIHLSIDRSIDNIIYHFVFFKTIKATNDLPTQATKRQTFYYSVFEIFLFYVMRLCMRCSYTVKWGFLYVTHVHIG